MQSFRGVQQTLTQSVRQVEPLVQHGIQELQGGLPIDHVLREVAMMAVLVGRGASAAQAIQQVEQVESALLGMLPGEARVEPGVHGAAGMGFGKGVPYGYGKQAMMPYGVGKPAAMPYGVGKPAAMPYGVGKPAAMPYGVGKQQPMGMAPYGKGWMGY